MADQQLAVRTPATNGHSHAEFQLEQAPSPQPHRPPPGPQVMALMMLLLGTLPIAFTAVGFVPPAAQGVILPFSFAVSGIGLLTASAWAAASRSAFDAAVFCVFGTLELGGAALNLGLVHNWYAIPPADIAKVQELFYLTFSIVVFMIVLVSLYTPRLLTVFFSIIDLSLVLSLLAAANPSVNMTRASGVATFAFDAIAMYMLMGSGAAIFGQPEPPLGRPLLADRRRSVVTVPVTTNGAGH